MCMQYAWPCVLIFIYYISGVKYLYMFSQLYEGVKPTLGELEKFEATPDEVELNGKNNSPTISSTTSWYMYDTTVTSGGGDSKAGPTLAPGDIVEVSEGQLMHLQGKVINVEGDVVTIMPKHEDLKVRMCV